MKDTTNVRVQNLEYNIHAVHKGVWYTVCVIDLLSATVPRLWGNRKPEAMTELKKVKHEALLRDSIYQTPAIIIPSLTSSFTVAWLAHLTKPNLVSVTVLLRRLSI